MPERGLAACKVGLSQFDTEGWVGPFSRLREELGGLGAVVPAVYADHDLAGGPTPESVISAASAIRVRRIVIDTWDKSPGANGLMPTLGHARLVKVIRLATDHQVRLMLAGRLSLEDAGEVLKLACEARSNVLLGVRGGVCDGGRAGVVSHTLVARFVSETRDRLAGICSQSATERETLPDQKRRTDAKV